MRRWLLDVSGALLNPDDAGAEEALRVGASARTGGTIATALRRNHSGQRIQPGQGGQSAEWRFRYFQRKLAALQVARPRRRCLGNAPIFPEAEPPLRGIRDAS